MPSPTRAGVLVVRDGRVAAIERVRDGRTYWVVPGGSVEPGESLEDAARREALEELGTAVVLGQLRVDLLHTHADGTVQRQVYFAATVDTDHLEVKGPEATAPPERGSYRAVWLPLAQLASYDLRPAAVGAALVP